MSNLIAFLNSFLSYLLVMVVVIIVCAIAGYIGITLRKKKNLTEDASDAQGVDAEN